MAKRLKIKITLVDKVGKDYCHRGHKIGDSWDYDKDRGNLCPLVMHTLFPMIDILRYGGELPISSKPVIPDFAALMRM